MVSFISFIDIWGFGAVVKQFSLVKQVL